MKIRQENSGARVIGLDVHPESFAGAILEGRDPASAVVVHSSTRVELAQLERWASRHAQRGDVLVLEASGNAFAVAERLRGLGLSVQILDSHQAGKVGKVYCTNDRVDAVKLARIYPIVRAVDFACFGVRVVNQAHPIERRAACMTSSCERPAAEPDEPLRALRTVASDKSDDLAQLILRLRA